MSGFDNTKPIPTLKYTAPKTVAEFMQSDAFHRAIRGPIGSGKSVGCCVEILRRSLEMPPWNRGIRSSKWAVARNTSKELRNTTLDTWMKWMRDFGTWNESKSLFHLRFADVDSRVLFLPLDTPADIGRLLSLEVTGMWWNESREMPLSILTDAKGRIGRYPAEKDLPPDLDIPKWYQDDEGRQFWYWAGLICDTNSPEIDSDWYKLFEHLPQIDGDENSTFICDTFAQPSGLSPEAENKENLRPGYYESRAKGATKAWIDTYVHGKYSPSQLGKPVYHTSFNYERHVSPAPLRIDPQLPVVIGFDCGLTPAAGFFQMGLDGRVRLLREAYAFDMGMKRFAQNHMRPIVRNYFPTNPLIFIGDPSGGNRAQSDEATAFQMIKLMFEDDEPTVKAAPTNDLAPRIQALEQLLCQYPDGEPLFLIDPSCKRTVDALRSKYRYPKLKMSGEFSASPEKNDWSHLTEALQYGALFLLGGRYTPGDYMRMPNTDPFNFMQKPAYRPAQMEGY